MKNIVTQFTEKLKLKIDTDRIIVTIVISTRV